MKTAVLLDRDLAFGPKRLRGAIYSVGLLGLGIAMGWGERNKPIWRAASDAPLPVAQMVTDGTIVFIILVGLAFLLATAFGVPRLTATRQGLVLRMLFRRVAVPWDRLGTFSVVFGQGRHAEQALKATAPILVRDTGSRPDRAPESKRRQRTRGSIAIPNVFAVPLITILENVRDWHAQAGLPSSISFTAAPERPVGVPGFRFPWLTMLLLGVFIGVFVLEQRLAITPGQELSPSVATLIALGGLSLDLAHAGQWYRILTAPFLHSGLPHLIANGIAFTFAGYALERFVGRAWTFGIFACGALAGAFASLFWATPSTVSVGASGAIMAMLVALFMISFRLPPGRAKTFVQVQSARVAIPAVIPVMHGGAIQVDYGAHFGGAAFGGILGLLLLFAWEENSPLPTLRTFAAVFSVVAALSFVRCAYVVAEHYPAYTVIAGWMPVAEFPKSPQEIALRADYLLATYPRDPRAHFFAALARLQKNDRARAEQQLKIALVEAEAFPSMFPPSMLSAYRVLLGRTVLEEGRQPEARMIAHPACLAVGEAVPEPAFKAALDQSGLCN
jgi:rhomboid protease GluP